MARGTVTVYSLPNINIGSSKVYFTIRVSNIFCLHVGGERFVAEIAAVLRLGAPPRCNRLFFLRFLHVLHKFDFANMPPLGPMAKHKISRQPNLGVKWNFADLISDCRC